MTETAQPHDPLVDHLEDLSQRQDRAVLARLRRSLSEQAPLQGLSVVLPFVRRDGRGEVAAEDDAVLLAGLFALHPEPGRTTLPGALREIARSSDSVEQRFRALLGAARPDLPVHLRHAVGLVGSHHIALDWRELHRAIRFWDHPSGRTKRAWARQFWAAGDPAAEHAEHTTA